MFGDKNGQLTSKKEHIVFQNDTCIVLTRMSNSDSIIVMGNGSIVVILLALHDIIALKQSIRCPVTNNVFYVPAKEKSYDVFKRLPPRPGIEPGSRT